MEQWFALRPQPERARQYGLPVLHAALEGINGATAARICFVGYGAA